MVDSPLIYVFLALGLLLGGYAAWHSTQVESVLKVRFSEPFQPTQPFGDLNQEFISLRNMERSPVDLSGWTISNEQGAVFAFPEGFVLDAGSFVTLYTGCADEAASERKLHWCSRRPVWPDEVGRAVLRAADGTVIQDHRYDYDCFVCDK